jgi:HlyD family secretion protein
LQVRAGIDGVLQQLNVEVGQRIEAGGILGKVARPDKLKAQLKIPETQARDIQPGQIAQIDTRHGIAQGRVQRVDPAVQEGTVTVDVTFDAPLPRGSRPDLAVDGAIELERLTNVLFIGRPAGAEEESTIQLFRLVDDDEAERVDVRLGRASSDMVEVRSGLAEGEQIVLSQVPGGAQIKRIRIQ